MTSGEDAPPPQQDPALPAQLDPAQAAPAGRELVPIEQLVDLEALSSGGRAPSLHRLREALPPGWVLESDGRHARRDLRVLARDGWVLLVGLVAFGSAGLALFWTTFPRGWRGVSRLLILIVAVLFAGLLAGPMITRALTTKPRRRAE